LVKEGSEGKGEQGVLEGEVELGPIQERYFEELRGDGNCFNQSVMLQVSSEVTGKMQREVSEELARQHDALRLRYERRGGEWRQHMVGEEGVEIYSEVELEEVREE